MFPQTSSHGGSTNQRGRGNQSWGRGFPRGPSQRMGCMVVMNSGLSHHIPFPGLQRTSSVQSLDAMPNARASKINLVKLKNDMRSLLTKTENNSLLFNMFNYKYQQTFNRNFNPQIYGFDC